MGSGCSAPVTTAEQISATIARLEAEIERLKKEARELGDDIGDKPSVLMKDGDTYDSSTSIATSSRGYVEFIDDSEEDSYSSVPDVPNAVVSENELERAGNVNPGVNVGRNRDELSTSFFNELFPREKSYGKKTLPGSFPEIGDFEGGLHEVGKGASGLVFKSTLHGVPVALKVSKEKTAESNRSDYHEWSVSERLNPHPNVVQVVGLCPAFKHPSSTNVGSASTNVGSTAIISPWQENGSLRSFFDGRKIRPDDLVNVALGMIRGVGSLHEQGVLHRDVAVRNFLVGDDGRVLLCDFGLSEFLPKGKNVLNARELNYPQVLPWRNLAPESFDLMFSRKSDIWMYGIALLELITGNKPWHTFNESGSLKKAMDAKEVALPLPVGNKKVEVPPLIAEIIRDCCELDPTDRPTADDIAERLVRWQFRHQDLDRDEEGNTPFLRLIIDGETSEVYKVICSKRPLMVNAVNNLGETALMLANDDIKEFLMRYTPIPSVNAEPSRNMEFFHNTDLFPTLIELVKAQDEEAIVSLGRIGLAPEYISRDRDAFASCFKNQRGYHEGEPTPFHFAAEIGNVALIEALFSLRVLPAGQVDGEGRTALHVASMLGHVEVVEALLRVRESDESKDANQDTHLRVDVNTQDMNGKTALHLAVANGNLRATKVLLSFENTNVKIGDSNKLVPLFYSITGGNNSQAKQIPVLQALLEHEKVDVNTNDSNGETIMHKVARENLAQVAEFLLERSDLNVSAKERSNDYTPLHLAVLERSAQVAELLVSHHGAEVNAPDKNGNTPLHILANMRPAVTPEKIDVGMRIARLFASHGDIDVNRANAFGNTALHLTARRANAALAEELLSISKIDVNAIDGSGNTPLHVAARGGDIRVVEVLLSSSEVDVNAKGERGEAVLHIFAAEKNLEFAKLLLGRNDVDVNAGDEHGETALHVAITQGNLELARLLLSRNDINVNAEGREGDTAFYRAVFKDHVDLVREMAMRSDTDVNAGLENGESPISNAIDNLEMLKCLLSIDRVDVNAGPGFSSMLHFLCEDPDVKTIEAVKAFLSRDDIDVNSRKYRLDRTPLHVAASSCAPDLVALFAAREEIDVNARDSEQSTPLHLALDFAPYHRLDDEEVIELIDGLLSHKELDVNAKDQSGKTAIDYAEEGSFAKCADLLRKRA